MIIVFKQLLHINACSNNIFYLQIRQKRKAERGLLLKHLEKPKEAAEGSKKESPKAIRVINQNPILHGYCLIVLTVLVLHIKPIKRSIHVDFNGKIRKAKKIENCVFLYLLVSLQMQVQWSSFGNSAKNEQKYFHTHFFCKGRYIIFSRFLLQEIALLHILNLVLMYFNLKYYVCITKHLCQTCITNTYIVSQVTGHMTGGTCPNP